MILANSDDPRKKGLESKNLEVRKLIQYNWEQRDMNQDIDHGMKEKYIKWQCVAMEKSIKSSIQLNGRGKNKESNICFSFGQLN